MATSVKALLSGKRIRKVLSVQPSTTVYDALLVMAEHNIGALLVMENDHLAGIFSERDYARKGIIQGRKASSTSISEVMTSSVYTVDISMTIVECMEIMSARKFRHLPVMDNGRVAGIVSVGDIVTALIQEQKTHINFLESYITG